MKLINTYNLDFGDESQLFFDLLSEEDFDFKTKDIKINLNLVNKKIEAGVFANNVIDLKIGNSAFIKSLEIINKTLVV
jgi:hypothetical protein